MAECVAHVVLAGVTAVAWVGAGAAVLARLPDSGDGALDVLNRLGAGAVAFALLTFAAGWLGLLHPFAYVVVLVAAAAWGAVTLARVVPRRPPSLHAWPRWQLALAGLIALYALAQVAVTCAPISSGDALFYHATVPELFEREGRIFEVDWVWQSYQPFTGELLVLDGFLLWDSVQGAFAPLLLGLGGAATVYVAAQRLASRPVALLATAVYLCQPFAVWLLTSTFVEPAAAFTVALAVANLARFARGAGAEALVLAGLFTGATAGMKYVAAGAAAVLAAAALVALRRRLNARLALAFALPAVAVALPWFAKNVVLVGDPAYPILLGWPSDEAREEAWSTFDDFGYGRSALDLLLLPVRLLADAEPFNRAEFVSPLFLLFAPLALLDARARRHAAVALGAVGAFVLVWFASVQDARYLMFAMPVLAVLAALGIVSLARAGSAGRALSVAAVVASLAVSAAISGVYVAQFVPYLAGTESEEGFLRDAVSYHESVQWLNENVPRDGSALVGHGFVLHVDPYAVAWTSDALPVAAGREETRAFFRRHEVTHAIVFETFAGRKRQLEWVGARRVARVPARAVVSRTRREVGPVEMLDAYVVPRVP